MSVYIYVCACVCVCVFVYTNGFERNIHKRIWFLTLHESEHLEETGIKLRVWYLKKRTLFSSTLDLELRKKLVKCYLWSIALYGAETWTLRTVDQKHLESFEMWCWRRMEKISWTDHVRN
jgi:hypothetical protein